jgi:ribosomal protein S16
MGLVIKLRKQGNIRKVHYEIVVTETKTGVVGKFIDILGYSFLLHSKPYDRHYLVYNKYKLAQWISKGAVLSKSLKKKLNI